MDDRKNWWRLKFELLEKYKEMLKVDPKYVLEEYLSWYPRGVHINQICVDFEMKEETVRKYPLVYPKIVEIIKRSNGDYLCPKQFWKCKKTYENILNGNLRKYF